MANPGAIRAGKAYVELFADQSKLTRGLRLAEQQLRKWGAKVQGLGRQMAYIGGAMLAPAVLSVRTFRDFDDVMRAVKAVTGATGEEFDALNEKAKFLGRTTSFTAAQVASGMLELGRAGFAPKEIDAAIDAVLNLARATGTDLAEAANIAAGTLRSFGLNASDMTRVADVMTATANNSAQTLTDLGEAMKYAAPVAADFEMTLEDTAKALGTLANFSIKGSMAGTSIRMMLLRMADPGVRKQMKALGVSIRNAKGQLKDASTILQDVGAAMRGLPSEKRLEILNNLFGMRAISGGAKLSTTSFERLNTAIANAAGTADRTAKTMDSGLGGALRRMWSAAEGIRIALGNALAKPLSIINDLLAAASNRMTDWIDKHKTLVNVLSALAALLVGAGIALIAFGLALKLAAFALGSVLAVFKFFKGVVLAVRVVLAMILSPLGAVIALMTAAGVTIAVWSGAAGKAVAWLGQRFRRLASDAATAWEAITAAYASGDLGLAARIAWLTVKMEWAKGTQFLKEMWLDFKTWFLKVGYDAFYGALAAWEYARHGITVGMIEVVSASIKAWNVFSSWWRRMINWIAQKLGWLYSKVMSLFDDSWDHAGFMEGFSRAIQDENAELAKELQQQNRTIEAQRTDQRQKARSRHDTAMEAIATDYADASTKLDAGHEKRLANLQDRLDEARRQWQEAIQTARTRKDALDRADEKGQGTPALPRLPDVGPRLAETAASSMGTFVGLAAGRMTVGGVSEKLIDASVETARNTKDILRQMESSGAFM